MTEKQGLRGWKAFFVVLISGGLAGLLVVFSVFGLVKQLISSLGSPVESGSDRLVSVGSETGRPIESLEEGKLNICTTTIDTLSTVQVERMDSKDNYVDEVKESGDPLEGARVVSDECHWKLSPEYSSLSRWDLHVVYEAIVDPPKGEDAIEIASKEFVEKKSLISEYFSQIESQGAESLGDDSYFFYGSCGDGEICYVFLGRTRGSLYEISLSSPAGGGDVPPEAFRNEVGKLVSGIDLDLGLWIPE